MISRHLVPGFTEQTPGLPFFIQASPKRTNQKVDRLLWKNKEFELDREQVFFEKSIKTISPT